MKAEKPPKKVKMTKEQLVERIATLKAKAAKLATKQAAAEAALASFEA